MKIFRFFVAGLQLYVISFLVSDVLCYRSLIYWDEIALLPDGVTELRLC